MTIEKALEIISFPAIYEANETAEAMAVISGAYDDGYRLMKPCEDCVSKKAAVKAVRDNDWAQAIFTIAHLPPVTPERTRGMWVEHEGNPTMSCNECSVCNGWSNIKYAYCPHCGADMMEVDDNVD